MLTRRFFCRVMIRYSVPLTLALVLTLAPVSQADTVYLPIIQRPARPPQPLWFGHVVRIVDGHTIVVTLDCCPCIESFKVRLIGIDAPERGECYYSEAKAALGAMVEGQRVVLWRDVSEWDSFGRLLRHVSVMHKPPVNGYMVEQGFARAKAYPPDTSLQDIYESLQAQAQREGRGGWRACGW